MNKEILRRYSYLYENTEIILSLCIKPAIEEEYYKQCLKNVKNAYTRLGDNDSCIPELTNIYLGFISRYEKNLRTPKYYLMDQIPEDIVKLIEDFLTSDNPLEETNLYKEIETIKSDEVEMANAEYLVEAVLERRKENEYLASQNPFTVWRILDYVRNNNLDNQNMLEFLDIFYNLDRHVTSGLEWVSGYHLLDSDKEKNAEYIRNLPTPEYTRNIETKYYKASEKRKYRCNEFEHEDDYTSPRLKPYNNFFRSLTDETMFVIKAIFAKNIGPDEKKDLYRKLNGQSKRYIFQ